MWFTALENIAELQKEVSKNVAKKKKNIHVLYCK